MLKTYCLLLMAISIAINSLYAQQPSVTVLDKAPNGADMFMDMALAAAQTSVNDGGKPCGAVVIERGGWEGTGMAIDDKTAVESVILNSSPNSWSDVSIYTITQPTTKSLNLINRQGIKAVYFTVPAEKVISLGIYPAEAFDTANLDPQYTMTQLFQVPFQEAETFVESNKLHTK